MQHCAINETEDAEKRDTKRRNIFMDREWEKFKGGPAVAMKDRIHVTINAKGMILLNANVHRLLGKPTAVNLYFNRQRDQIAVEPAHPRLDLVFPVREKEPVFLHLRQSLLQTFRYQNAVHPGFHPGRDGPERSAAPRPFSNHDRRRLDPQRKNACVNKKTLRLPKQPGTPPFLWLQPPYFRKGSTFRRTTQFH